MIEIKKLTTLDGEALNRVIQGYVSHEKYVVTHIEDDKHAAISLELVTLLTPYHKTYEETDEFMLGMYSESVAQGNSFAAFDGDEMIGVALCEHREWNNTLWVWEFHISESHRGQRIGQRLMETVAQHGLAAGMRVIVCETQNTNVPAIRFYRRMGFRMEAVDLSYYANTDYPDGEIAVFMKRQLVIPNAD